ncbi:MAG: hypothetical protein SO063_03830 [Eubacteriales bacterium]|nr:hypothetical protein [Eubacteriales bacterium]
MVDANLFPGADDNEILENAVRGRDGDGIVVIPPRRQTTEPERDWWRLDRAVLLPENTTLVLRSCRVKLSDRCRDNFFRTANCGMGFAEPERIRNVHIRGEGLCVLEGADHPRATGDGSKLLARPCPYLDRDLCRYADWVPEERRQPDRLSFWDRHDHSYGTDADRPEESRYGDWRGIGILFANAEDFSVENLRIVNSHGWGISLEACAHGRIARIDFDACMSKEIDGMLQNMENQDGVDIRNGCHDILITDITGRTGDDMVALTAIANDDEPYLPGGSLCTTHVMPNDWSKRDRDIHDIVIRNVMGYSSLCFLVRLLPCGSRIRNVVIDGVVDTTPDGRDTFGGILLGDLDGYGRNLPDSLSGISISNVVCRRRNGVIVQGFLTDSAISNVVCTAEGFQALKIERPNALRNVRTSNLVSAGE